LVRACLRCSGRLFLVPGLLPVQLLNDQLVNLTHALRVLLQRPETIPELLLPHFVDLENLAVVGVQQRIPGGPYDALRGGFSDLNICQNQDQLFVGKGTRCFFIAGKKAQRCDYQKFE